MALTAEQQKKRLQDAYNLAKTQLEQDKKNALEQSASKLALETSQLAELDKEQQQSATGLAQKNYLNYMQNKRVMPTMMQQSGLQNSGYVGLAQNKAVQDLQKSQTGVKSELQNALAQTQRQRQSNKYSYDVAVQNANTAYTQGIASKLLNYNQDNQLITEAETAQKNLDALVTKANAGGLTLDQYKKELAKYGLSDEDIQALISAYNKYNAIKNTGINPYFPVGSY